MPRPRTLNKDFFNTWSPEMAYVLGYFAADGSMIVNRRGGCFIEFTTTDKILLDYLKIASGATQKIAIRPQRCENWKPQYRIQVGCKRWYESLSTLGFTSNKSKVMSFPKIPKSYFGDFVRGYFDGDGCVYFKKHFSKWHHKEMWVFTTSFTSGSRKFLADLHSELIGKGIKGGHITQKTRGHALVFSRHDSLALYRIMYNTGEVSGLFLPRKRDKFEQAIQILHLRP